MSTETGRYSRRRRIATGGMGEVWLAHDEVLHRDVAVKYLKREYADDEGFRTRFLQEARHAAGLLHPGIATVFDFGEDDGAGTPFLVMEYVEGRPLSDLLADGRAFDPERARDLVAQAAAALAVAHAAGVVHRDVKPGNLLVTPDGAVKVTDFGIARAGDGMALTATGQIVGTPSYLSPEQAEGQAATSASDVYALGVVLFECLSGRRPFVADSPVALALAHVREPVPDLPPGVPEPLAAITARALAKHPEDRYPDAAALADALAAAGPEPTLLLSAPVPAMPTAAPAVAGGATWSRLPGSRWPYVAAAALVALVVVALLVAALGRDGSDTPGPGSTAGPQPTPTTATAAPTVTVDPAAYVGKPVADVRAALAAKDLRTRVVNVDNPGGHAAGTVASLSPTGAVRTGTTLTLRVWGTPPKATPEKPKPGKGKGKGKH